MLRANSKLNKALLGFAILSAHIFSDIIPALSWLIFVGVFAVRKKAYVAMRKGLRGSA